MSVGYSTLYGDSAGGFAVIKDCPKLLVYRLVRERARRDEHSPVPESIITRAPSAELRPDQLDEDSLPPYEVLAKARHRGRTTWVWEAEVRDEKGRICSLSQMTIAVRPMPKDS